MALEYGRQCTFNGLIVNRLGVTCNMLHFFQYCALQRINKVGEILIYLGETVDYTNKQQQLTVASKYIVGYCRRQIRVSIDYLTISSWLSNAGSRHFACSRMSAVKYSLIVSISPSLRNERRIATVVCQ